MGFKVHSFRKRLYLGLIAQCMLLGVRLELGLLESCTKGRMKFIPEPLSLQTLGRLKPKIMEN